MELSSPFGSATDFFEHLTDGEVPHRCRDGVDESGFLFGHVVGGHEDLLDMDVERGGGAAYDTV